MPENTEVTIQLDSARLFRTRTVLAILNEDVEVSFLNPVEIRSGRERIGWASLSVQPSYQGKKSIYADLCFAYSSHERLSIETGTETLYARIEGVHELGAEPFETVGLYHGLLPQVWDMQIFGLEISRIPGFINQPYLGEAVL
jgi:hypothetical protein